MTLPIMYSAEIEQARAQNRPIVALESTIITHGMPYPDNLTTAKAVEKEIRAAGAVPATIAVLDGQICIGLETAQLDALAQAQDVAKLSRADVAAVIANGQTGATTVAATMILAHMAGIHTFATGGIGGVHRGAESSFDISADLQELAQTPINVVCAGAKAILDLPKTFELLETLGVPVIAYQSDHLPAFWSRTSPLPAALRMDTAEHIAAAFAMRQALGLPGGQLIANPIPASDEIPHHIITPWIEQALQDAQQNAINAKAVTPYVLGRIYALSKGKSLQANIALVKNNARLATKIAIAQKKI